MTAHACATDLVTSHEAAATVDTNRSQAAVLRLLREYIGRYFTHKAVVTTYRRVSTQQELTNVTDRLPHLSEPRVRTACSELARKRLLRHAGGRRESIWELPDKGKAQLDGLLPASDDHLAD